MGLILKDNSKVIPRAQSAYCMTSFKTQYLITFFAALAFTLIGIVYVHPSSILDFLAYYLIWIFFISVFHRELIFEFSFAYILNSSFISLFFLIQTYIYPDSYGTTSPLSNSWTDDSYFFSLAADSLPHNFGVRDNYFLYTHPYSQLVKLANPFFISHPMDVIFFQSGVASLLITFTKKFVFDISRDLYLANISYFLILACPYLMMNGGVIFIRDTFVAALLIYSLSCFYSGKFILALAAIILQFVIRPGTAMALLLVYPIVFWSNFRSIWRRNILLFILIIIAIGLGLVYIIFSLDFSDLYSGTADGGQVSLIGRELFTDLTANQDSNVFFLKIQEFPFFLKIFINAAYIFAYPFLSFDFAFGIGYFDLRSIVMGFLVPVQSVWLNSWFFAGLMVRDSKFSKIRNVTVSMIVVLMILGIYSLQTRHKTVIYPLYYIIIAVGFVEANRLQKILGFAISFMIFIFIFSISFLR